MMKVSREGDNMRQSKQKFYYPQEQKAFAKKALSAKAWFWIHSLMNPNREPKGEPYEHWKNDR